MANMTGFTRWNGRKPGAPSKLVGSPVIVLSADGKVAAGSTIAFGQHVEPMSTALIKFLNDNRETWAKGN